MFVPMAKSRSRQPRLLAFGAWLQVLRGSRTRQQISIKLADLGVPLGGATLAQYEAGTVWAPDPGALWGLSEIYKVPFTELVALLRVNRARPDSTDKDWLDLLRQAQDPPSSSIQGADDVPASARIIELEAKIRAYEDSFSDLKDALRHLGSIAERVFAVAPSQSTAAPTRRKHTPKPPKALAG